MSVLADEPVTTGDSPVVETDILIIGAGPSGLYGAYYAGFRGLRVTVMDVLPQRGGQISAMYPEKPIFDIAGFPAVRGRDLVDNLVAQAEPYGVRYLLGQRAVELSHRPDGRPVVRSDTGTTVRAGAVVITGGVGTFTPRPLPAGERYLGRGQVYFVPDPADHTDQDVVVVGGGTAPSTGRRRSPRSPGPSRSSTAPPASAPTTRAWNGCGPSASRSSPTPR